MTLRKIHSPCCWISALGRVRPCCPEPGRLPPAHIRPALASGTRFVCTPRHRIFESPPPSANKRTPNVGGGGASYCDTKHPQLRSPMFFGRRILVRRRRNP